MTTPPARPAMVTDAARKAVRTAIARELDREGLAPFDRLDNAATAAILAMQQASGGDV